MEAFKLNATQTLYAKSNVIRSDLSGKDLLKASLTPAILDLLEFVKEDQPGLFAIKEGALVEVSNEPVQLTLNALLRFAAGLVAFVDLPRRQPIKCYPGPDPRRGRTVVLDQILRLSKLVANELTSYSLHKSKDQEHDDGYADHEQY
jgi:hypothetical protein